MASKTKRWFLVLVVFFFMSCWLSGAFATGWLLGRKSVQAQTAGQAAAPLPLATPAAGPAPNKDLEQLFQPFWEAWDLVHRYYVEQPVDDVALMRGAIRGMLDALGDRYTGYMDPQEYQDAQAPIEGSYEGIGAWVDVTKDYLTIISPIPGSPAAKAGLKPGDQIIGVDGEDVTGISPEVVRRRVLGPAGTKVRLTIRRVVDGEEQIFDVEIVRAKIEIPSVEYRMLDGDIGYVRFMMFGEKSDEELRKALEDLKKQGARGIIFDLRNNGGGLLTTAINVASQFIEKGQVVLYEQYGDGTVQVHKARGGGVALDIPMVVLVNEASASASEVVAGALQDYGRAPLIGERTFGKGSVQQWIPLRGDGGAVRITVAYWLTPKKRLIHEKGLEPDYLVPLDEDTIDWVQYEPDPATDPQLAKAIEVLQELLP